nr:metallophosphoesterase family protein [Natronomonas gomsonensis]
MARGRNRRVGLRPVRRHSRNGPDDGYRERVLDVVENNVTETVPTVGVSGHTHRVFDEEVDGYRLLNPGSATGAFPAQEATLMVAEVDGGDCTVELRRE